MDVRKRYAGGNCSGSKDQEGYLEKTLYSKGMNLQEGATRRDRNDYKIGTVKGDKALKVG